MVTQMTNKRLEHLLVKALKYINPALLDLTNDEKLYLGVPGTYITMKAPEQSSCALWLNTGSGYQCSCCGTWVQDRLNICPKCGRAMV